MKKLDKIIRNANDRLALKINLTKHNAPANLIAANARAHDKAVDYLLVELDAAVNVANPTIIHPK